MEIIKQENGRETESRKLLWMKIVSLQTFLISEFKIDVLSWTLFLAWPSSWTETVLPWCFLQFVFSFLYRITIALPKSAVKLNAYQKRYKIHIVQQ